MGRGAHAAHAAYNGSGTQGLAVTNKINENENEETHSVFLTENDTTKQIVHGCNISEMTCSGKIESVNSERYKIFTPDENADMLGDIYLNFEMDSKITGIVFDDKTSGTPIDLQNVPQEDLRKSFSMGGEDYNFMNVDYTNSSLPTVSSSSSGREVSYINKILHVTYSGVNYEIVVGKGTNYNMAIKLLSDDNPSWSNHNIANFSEIIDIIMITVDNQDLLIVGGRPVTGGSPYKVLTLSNSGGTLNTSDSYLTVTNDHLDKEFSIIVNILYEYEYRNLIMSGFKDHTDEVLRSPEFFHTDGAAYQTTFIIENLSYDVVVDSLKGEHRKDVTFNPVRDTASKRLASYNYKDCILSSSIKYDDTKYAYITGAKQKVLLALNDNGKIIRSYDNGLNWEVVNMYHGTDNYYPLSNMYQKNESLKHQQLNIFGFIRDYTEDLSLGELKRLISKTFGYVRNDIKLLNKIDLVEYNDNVTIQSIVTGKSIPLLDKTYNVSECLDIRIKNVSVINDYDHIWVNIPIGGPAPMGGLWDIGKNIRMTSKKFIGSIDTVLPTAVGAYTIAPTASVDPSDPNGIEATLTVVLEAGGIKSINVDTGGSGYDGTEIVTITPAAGETGVGGGAARVIIDRTQYLTLGEFKENINDMTGLNNTDYSLKIKYTIVGILEDEEVDQEFLAADISRDNINVADLGFLQCEKIALYILRTHATTMPLLDLDFRRGSASFQTYGPLTLVKIGGDTVGAAQGTGDPLELSTLDGLKFPSNTSLETGPSALHVNWTTKDFTIEIYVKLSNISPQTDDTIFSFHDALYDVMWLGRQSDNRLVFNSGVTGQLTSDIPVFANDEWVHIVATHTNNDSKSLFINGIFAGGTRNTPGVSFNKGPRNNFEFGVRPFHTSSSDQEIRLFRVYDSVLDQSTITKIYDDRDKTYWNHTDLPDTRVIRFQNGTHTTHVVDERLNDKFKIYAVMNKNETVASLKTRLATIYGGADSHYIIRASSGELASDKIIYGDSGTSAIITHSTSINNDIIDTYNDTYNDVEIRFKNNHPLYDITDPKIVYISIPLTPGASGNVVERRTVSLLAEDLSTRVYITLGQLKNKIKSLLDPLYTDLSSSGNYTLSLVKGGIYDGNIDFSSNNFYGIGNTGVPHFDDSLKIDDQTVGIQSGNILYFYFAYAGDPYVYPTSQMNNRLNVSFGTDPLYSEFMISRLGVLDSLKYYIPTVNLLVNNDKGLWVAAGPPSDDPDFSMTGTDSSGNLIEEALKRPNLVVFVSNNDGYNWYPLKFSLISADGAGVRPKYELADASDYSDPDHSIEFISGYVSNSQGDIRITFNIKSGGVLVTSGILDIDHYQICPDVISNNIKAITVADILGKDTALNLTLATSINNEFDIYVHSEAGKYIISQTVNSDIKYLYNNPTITSIESDSTDNILTYKKLGSYLISIKITEAVWGVVQTEISRQPSIGGNSENIKIDGETNRRGIGWTYYLETDSINKSVLLSTNSLETKIYSYEDANLNFKLVATLSWGCNNVNFLENVWIISGNNKISVSYDTIHWREITTLVSINEIFSKNNRYHDSILVRKTAYVPSFKPKELLNNINRYMGLSLFHDSTIKGGIKVNVNEELIADRTNYIIESYITPSKMVQSQIYGANFGALYEPNDIIKISNRVIICGNSSGRTQNSPKTLSLIESRTNSDNKPLNADDIVFFGVKSVYTHQNIQNNKEDFISNFDMERFYKDTNVSSDIIYCSGSYTRSDGTSYGILAIRSIPLSNERLASHEAGAYFWKLIYAPSLTDVPGGSYARPSLEPGEGPDFTLTQAPWQDTVFEKINDIVFADNKAVIVGKGKNEVNLCYSDEFYPDWFGRYNNSETDRKVELDFDEIFTVCFYKGHWFVGGRPKYKKDTNNIYTRNEVCLAYTDDITNNSKWVYKSFQQQQSSEHHGSSSIYEVNNMEIIDINGNTSILTNISYVALATGNTPPENLIMAVIFIDLDNLDNLSFSNHTPFKSPGIKEISATSGRIFNDKFALTDPDGTPSATSYDREKWLNRPFDLEINGISRKIISTIHSPKTKDMYYVEYNSSLGFILISYKDPYIPIIDKSDSGEYPKFIKHIKLGSETLTNKTNGHCYKMAKVTNENFITGLNSARYVAVGKGILSPISYSDDFENWTYSDAGNIFDIVFDVAHKHGIWIAIGEGNYNVGISKDGKSWTGIPPIEERENLITTIYDSTLNSLSFSSDTKITNDLPYIPDIKGIFLRNLSILRLFSRIEYHVGAQIWQTLTFDDIKAMLDTEFGAGEYANLLKNCSIINKDGSTKLTTWIPGFTKTLNSKLENFHNVSESGSFPSGLLKDQKLSIKIYYNKLENIIGNELTSSDMNNAVFDNFMNNTLIPCERNPNYFIDSFLADNYGFQLGDKYQNVNGKFKLNFSTEIQRLRLYCKQFELDEVEIDDFNKGVKQVPKITQSLYFDADNVGNMSLDLDNFNMYASHIIVSGWLTSDICITDMNLELNGYSYNKTFEPSTIDYATKLCLGLNYNRYTFNGVDKEDGIGSLVIPLASTAYSGSSVPLDRYSSIRLKLNFNAIAGPRSYINVTCVGTTTVSYNNSTANIDLF